MRKQRTWILVNFQSKCVCRIHSIKCPTYSFIWHQIVFPSTMTSLSEPFEYKKKRREDGGDREISIESKISRWQSGEEMRRARAVLFWNDRHLQTVCDELPSTVSNPSTLRGNKRLSKAHKEQIRLAKIFTMFLWQTARYSRADLRQDCSPIVRLPFSLSTLLGTFKFSYTEYMILRSTIDYQFFN